MDVAVLGAGSWGTALALVLCDAGHAVTLWGRSGSDLDELRRLHENRRYLPGVPLPPSLRATDSLADALSGRRLVLTAVPTHVMREVMTRAAPLLHPEALVVSASKGIENETLATMDEVLAEVLPEPLGRRAVFLSGPSFAREVAQRLPTAVVVASRDAHAAEQAQAAFATERFRVYTADDVPGVEVGGAVKNVMAIACGISDGLGFGHNTRAAIVTRGLAEISRLATRRGAHPLTLAGLAGLGDLVLTCTGDLSRNRTLGLKLGHGMKLADALAELRQVAEGVRTTRSTRDLSHKLGVEMPITETVFSILYEDKPAAEGVVELLRRPSRTERD